MKKENIEYLNIRITGELKDWVKEQAKKNYRTASLEVEKRLRESRMREESENATA